MLRLFVQPSDSGEDHPFRLWAVFVLEDVRYLIQGMFVPEIYSPIGEYLTPQTLLKINQKRSWCDEHLEIVE